MNGCNGNAVIHKDVVIIGNGPSGIALSYMLSGNIPYVVSNNHPDEMLSARLSASVGESLIDQDLEYLASGLEGRSTNPVSLLLDSLIHPCADIGLEMEPLVEWRKNGFEIDHVVFGKGPPGGSWHTMDPHILTLSLGAWMALPGMKYQARDSTEKRAFACNVARYYEQYVKEMGLSKYFHEGAIVTSIRPTNEEDSTQTELCTPSPENMETDMTPCSPRQSATCTLTNALNFILSRGHRKWKTGDRCCKRKYGSAEVNLKVLFSKYNKAQEVENLLANNNRARNDMRFSLRRSDSNCDKNRSVSFSCDYENYSDIDDQRASGLGSSYAPRYLVQRSPPLRKVPKLSSDLRRLGGAYATTTTSVRIGGGEPKWIVDVYDVVSRSVVSYSCNYLVLANGSSDLPNRLLVSNDKRDPAWLLHDVRSLEIELDLYVQCNLGGGPPEPVLVVGAGLSAADAIIAARGKNVPVLHVFRNKSADLGKQLPENMYPEYHKVHQMMQDGGSTYPLYKALAEYTLTDYCEKTRSVTLASKEGKEIQFRIGLNRKVDVDAKTNPIAINKLNHSVVNREGLYAVGPIAGDNFVRFLPGGALAVVSDLYRKCRT